MKNLNIKQALHCSDILRNYFDNLNRIDDYFKLRKIERVKNIPPPLPGFGLDDDMFQSYDMEPENMEIDVVEMQHSTFDTMLEMIASFSPDNAPGKELKLIVKDITSGMTIETGMYTSITDTQRQEGIVNEIDGLPTYGIYPNTYGEGATQSSSPLPSSSIFLRGDPANNSGPTARQRGLFGHSAHQEFGIALDDIKPGQWYGVKDSTAVIVYGGVTYIGGQYFQGEKGNTSYTITSSIQSLPVGAYIRIKKFRTSAGIDIYNNHLIRGEFSDNKGPTHNHYLKGYWRG